MTKEDFATLIVGTVEQKDLQIRQVSNGFEFVGNRRFLDADTLTEKFSLSLAGVAADGPTALQCIQNFYTTGAF